MNRNREEQFSFWVILALLSGIVGTAPLMIDIFLPAMPQAAEDFSVNVGSIQVTMGWLMVGTALGQVIFGPAADRFGRRPVLIWSMGLFTVFCLLTSLAPNIIWLYGGRFVLGLLSASGHILMRAIVRDLYSGPMAAKMMAYAFVTGGLMPILAPIIGGYLTSLFSWQATLLASGIYGAVLTYCLWRFLHETGVPDKEALDVNKYGKTVFQFLKSKDYMLYTLATAGPFGGLFALLTGLSPIIIQQLAFNPPQFGYWFGFIMLGNFFASFVAGKLTYRIGVRPMTFTGALLCAGSGLAAYVFTQIKPLEIGVIVIPSFVYMVGFALVMPAAMAGAMAPFPDQSGRASSFMGLINLGTGALVAFLLGIFADGTEQPMVIALATSGLITLAISVLLPKPVVHTKG